MDSYTGKHLDAWLDVQINGETRREQVRAAMVALIETDEEYWSGQGWWNVYDRAKCDRIADAA